MGLTSSLIVGQSALSASQLALQVTGNNLANAATPGYSRQRAELTPLRGDSSNAGLSVGAGVAVGAVRRQIDEALQARLWSGVSEEAAAGAAASIYSQIESTMNELSEQDLSSQLTGFFGAWSDFANQKQSGAVVVQQGERLAQQVRSLRSDLIAQRGQIDRQLAAEVSRADDYLARIAGLNTAISSAEVGGAEASALRDQRDQLVTELSESLGVTAVEQKGGGVDILVGSTPVVLGGKSRGVELVRETVDGETAVRVRVKDDGQELPAGAGRVGSLIENREAGVNGVVGRLDALVSQLIFEVNRIHSTGANEPALSETTGTLTIPSADRVTALNDPANRTFADLPFAASNGSFLVTVKNSATGATQTVRVEVDLDGRTASGAAGFGDDTSAEDIRAALDAAPGVSASFTADGRLKVTADAGFEFSFSEDTSGALAVLGVNSYFEGRNASDIAVRSDLQENPSLLMSGKLVDGVFVANGTAMRIAELQDRALPALGGRSVRDHWTDAVQQVGVDAAASATRARSTTLVRESLQAQRTAVSGVSTDEESINLLNYQRQYQAGARLISIVDQLTQTLIDLV